MMSQLLALLLPKALIAVLDPHRSSVPSVAPRWARASFAGVQYRAMRFRAARVVLRVGRADGHGNGGAAVLPL
jgi:hypothetical protein